MPDASVVAANLEEVANDTAALIRRPRLLFVTVTIGAVLLFAGGPGLAALVQEKSRVIVYRAKVGTGARREPVGAPPAPLPKAAASPPPPKADELAAPAASAAPQQGTAVAPPATCGDGVCAPSESAATCFADCPGPSTAASCGEELHSDPQGNAVVDGRGHHVKTAAECCAACQAHAAKFPRRPCNSWVFCYMPHCWSADNGNTHLFGECWLKWQTDPSHPLYGQRGMYTDEYRRRNRDKHLNGNYPTDKASVEAMAPFGIVPGSRRNLSVPTHVSWIGGVMGATVDRSVRWTTDADGTMRSSAGDVIVDYRPWESREQNLRRGVKPEQMRF